MCHRKIPPQWFEIAFSTLLSNIFTLLCNIFSSWSILWQNCFIYAKQIISRRFGSHLALFCKIGRCELPQISRCIKMRISKKFLNFHSVYTDLHKGLCLPSIFFLFNFFSIWYIWSYVCPSTFLSVCLSVYLSVFVYLSTRKSWFDYWLITLACRITSSFFCLTMDCRIKCEITLYDCIKRILLDVLYHSLCCFQNKMEALKTLGQNETILW